MNCIIVDDERLAREVLENYISRTPQLTLTASLSNAMDLFRHLHADTRTDLIFLDIKMPEISGLELISALKNVPDVIFTTAYHEHALDAFNLNATDYLLKPFSYERFLQAVSKSSYKNARKDTAPRAGGEQRFFVKSDKRLVSINANDILYIEGLKNYYVIVTRDNRSTIVHNTLGNLEISLSQYPQILRIHRSFFVNIQAIKEISGGDVLLVNNKEIPVSQMYREALMAKLHLL